VCRNNDHHGKLQDLDESIMVIKEHDPLPAVDELLAQLLEATKLN